MISRLNIMQQIDYASYISICERKGSESRVFVNFYQAT